jgi:hypothetical protein
MTSNTNTITNTIAKKTALINKLLERLKTAYISSDDYVSSKEPFFRQDNNAQSFQQSNKLFINAELPERLNHNIKLLYELLGDQKKEIYYGQWTIMSVEEALIRYKELCKHGQTNVFTIGYKYGGMGYIDLLSCDLTSHLLFYSLDGGSNDYDRIANANNLIKNGATPYNKFHFSDWFYNVNVT